MSSPQEPCDTSGHPSTLPGDPSLNLVTNVDLGYKKLEIMKGKVVAYHRFEGSFIFHGNVQHLWLTLFSNSTQHVQIIVIACSKAIQEATGKPEAYIGM